MLYLTLLSLCSDKEGVVACLLVQVEDGCLEALLKLSADVVGLLSQAVLNRRVCVGLPIEEPINLHKS